MRVEEGLGWGVEGPGLTVRVMRAFLAVITPYCFPDYFTTVVT